MKLLSYLLITASLCLGAVAATTAYLPTLDRVAADLAGPAAVLTLAAPAGLLKDAAGRPLLDPRGKPRPLVRPEGTGPLTPDLVARLRANGVDRVRLREFSFGRWTHAWLFFLAVAGLVAGALLVRRQTRRELRAELAAPGGGAAPDEAMAGIRRDLATLLDEVAALPAEADRMHRIVDRLGDLQQTRMETIVDARPALISRFGLAGFAELMDRFAALERRINRAWSAAADGAAEEALDCLREASRQSGAVAEVFERQRP